MVCGRGAARLCSTPVVHGAFFLWILLVKFWNEARSVGYFGVNREGGGGAVFFSEPRLRYGHRGFVGRGAFCRMESGVESPFETRELRWWFDSDLVGG